MSDNKNIARKKIEPLVAGDTRTLLSASTANELINALNMLLTLQAGKGIKVSMSAGAVVIELSDALAAQLQDMGLAGAGGSTGGTLGPITWQGNWNVGLAYHKGDIVIRQADADYNDGTLAGTYIAAANMTVAQNAANPPMRSEAGGFWLNFARAAFKKLLINNGGTDITTIAGGTIITETLMRVGAAAGGAGGISLATADLVGAVDVLMQETAYCDSGVLKTIQIPRTNPY